MTACSFASQIYARIGTLWCLCDASHVYAMHVCDASHEYAMHASRVYAMPRTPLTSMQCLSCVCDACLSRLCKASHACHALLLDAASGIRRSHRKQVLSHKRYQGSVTTHPKTNPRGTYLSISIYVCITTCHPTPPRKHTCRGLPRRPVIGGES